MVLFEFEVRDEAFMDWMDGLRHSFNFMIETMINVAEQIKDETQFRTPVETGKLSRSFRWTIVTDNSRMKVLQIRMSALNERTGYDYAWIQHEKYYKHEPKELGFVNYSSSFDAWEHHHGEWHYLKNAIMDKKQSSFEMIERDYLSLFEYGGIF